ncbi:MAG TPA: radical SAM protein [Acidobacteriota bacterium]|nr:radical SAM protein [Acidobacteriota bacterium]HNU01520.1 radical SAM protein [Acidobacteriota bacterium]HPB28378.1 radical SAM protein [Acidobacteriota bacterium]HQO25876.1 radical SAM protein [Acidobacteriota bacterium]HQP74226.1 radical SAM protein [Acidobacteriota bacterium]
MREAPVYRPPSEAESLILPVTTGCSWNRCAFCEMYTDRRYAVTPLGEIDAWLAAAARSGWPVRRVFLADGDPLAADTKHLLAVLDRVRTHFPVLNRISAYASPRNLRAKSDAELAALAAAGLGLVYAGIESGDDEVLRRVRKGETAASTVEALRRARAAGLRVSVMVINGLGGRSLSAAHAAGSAAVVSAVDPEYVSTLILGLPPGGRRFRAAFGDDFEPLDAAGLLTELGAFVGAVRCRRAVFRSDHASNFLPLRGILSRDRDRLLAEIAAGLAAFRDLPLSQIRPLDQY